MRVLWLKTDVLHPVDNGGKIRTYQMLKRLHRQHEVTFLCLRRDSDSGEAVDLATEYCRRLVTVPWSDPPRFSAAFYAELARNMVSSLPYNMQKYSSKSMRAAIRQELTARKYDVVCCDFLFPWINFDPKTSPAATLLFQHNVESALWNRQWRVQRNALKLVYFYLQYLKLRAHEVRACQEFDLVVAVSDADRDFMKRDFLVKECHSVPTGVDTEFYQPCSEPRSQHELVFTGAMDWMPNEDAICWFAADVLPKIAAEIPEVRFTVVGRNPTPTLKKLAGNQPRLNLTGRVDDIRPYVARAAVYVVPIRVGGGTRLKVYEAMAMQKAIVSTSVGAEGLDVVDGKEIRYANDADSFARVTIELLRDEAQCIRLATAAREAVVERFGWCVATRAFDRALQRAVELRRQRQNCESQS
jgi:sugar transferase (PEP-CTERM/EpsH1 system associated)